MNCSLDSNRNSYKPDPYPKLEIQDIVSCLIEFATNQILVQNWKSRVVYLKFKRNSYRPKPSQEMVNQESRLPALFLNQFPIHNWKFRISE